MIWGKEDQIIPAAHAGNLPGAKVHVLEGAGHMVFMEKASDVNSLIKAHIAGSLTDPVLQPLTRPEKGGPRITEA